MMAESSTKTKVVVNIPEITLDGNRTIEAPLFIMFAEYLGYISKLNKYAEEWCDGKVPDAHVQKVIIVEAKSIYRQMIKDYDMDTIKDYFKTYYPIILKDYDDKLQSIIKK